jgi:sugar/nucleoside kinase (ribokinase family)
MLRVYNPVYPVQAIDTVGDAFSGGLYAALSEGKHLRDRATLLYNSKMMQAQSAYRRTTQTLAPVRYQPADAGQYNIYPSLDIGAGKIELGYAAWAAALKHQQRILLDGYGGVLWPDLRERLDQQFVALGLNGLVPKKWTQ